MSDIIKTQRSLATKAKHNPLHQFDHLYRLICREDWIRAALKSVLSNKGAKTAGIDGVTKKELVPNTAKDEFVSKLQAELRSKQFKPKPVRRVYIPKANDKRLLKLIGRFLKAGMMQGSLFHRTVSGTPQGAICSPLLANIYLHQLDMFWWNKYGSLNRKQKEKRRTQRLGNCALIRYADDWLLLTNGGKEEAYRLREEFQSFLKEELKLERGR